MTIFKIFKYPLTMAEDQSIEIDGAVMVLSIVKQQEKPVMYVLIDPEKEQYNKNSVFEIKIIGTGNEIQNKKDANDFFTYEFMNTLGFHNGFIEDGFMLHFFVRRRFLE